MTHPTTDIVVDLTADFALRFTEEDCGEFLDGVSVSHAELAEVAPDTFREFLAEQDGVEGVEVRVRPDLGGEIAAAAKAGWDNMSHREKILTLVYDQAGSLLWDDRKDNCGEWPGVDDIDNCVEDDEISIDEMVEAFRLRLVRHLG